MTQSERMRAFCDALWTWYRSHKRDLPWRHIERLSDTERAYRVFVSEMMLQQTQVPRVTVLFPMFLEKFPSLGVLAEAGNRDVVLAWQGLGYNNRALRLRDSARAIMTTHQGVFPSELADLRVLPGIGPYTAAAIRNFAFNLPTPCVDINIERILSRVFFPPSMTTVRTQEMERLAADLLMIAIDGTQGRDAREWHSALMDFGSLVCTKKSPRYDVCPLFAAGLYLDPYKETGIPKARTEPNRGGTPNRIFRGRIVESLRTMPGGLTASAIGRRICTDWTSAPDEAWLAGLLDALKKDALIAQKGQRYMLAD